MNALRNKIQLIGNLGQAPEVRTLEAGRKLAKFSIAVNDRYKSGTGEWIKETQWHSVIAWGKMADIVETYLDKGMEVVVEGKLICRDYTDKNGDVKHVAEIVANDILLLGERRKGKKGVHQDAV